MPYCYEETEVGEETVKCEKPPEHDGPHVGYVPQEDTNPFMWPTHEWEDEA